MRPGGGKQKGGAFERKVCKDLSRYVTHGKHDDLFWRSAMSGGRATVQRKRGTSNRTQVGDISCVHADGHWFTDTYVIECKCVRTLDIRTSLVKHQGELLRFWKQVCTEADAVERMPLLIAKENNTPTLVFMYPHAAHKLKVLGFRVPEPILVSLTLQRKPDFAVNVYLYDQIFKLRQERIR